MIESFKKITTMIFKPLIQDKNHQLLLKYIGSDWYMKKKEEEANTN